MSKGFWVGIKILHKTNDFDMQTNQKGKKRLKIAQWICVCFFLWLEKALTSIDTQAMICMGSDACEFALLFTE